MTDGISGVNSVAPVQDTEASGNSVTDSLLWTTHWAPDTGSNTTTLTFSFPDANSQFNTNAVTGYAPDSEAFNGVAALSDNAQNIFKSYLANLERFSNLVFEEVDDSGDSADTIRVAFTNQTDDDAVAFAYLPGRYQAAADIWVVAPNHGENDVDFGHTLGHELGHALGLKHSFEAEEGFPAIAANLEGVDYTLMSYTVSARFPTATYADLWPQTYMYADILAIQHLYGVDTVTTAGADSYAYSQDDRHYLTIWDYGGSDTLSVTGTKAVKLDLTPGSWSNVGTTIEYWDGSEFFYDSDTVYITPDTVIENATGASGNDTLVGNEVANRLRGNDGDDMLMGNAGNDVIVSGKGSDVAVAGAGDDTLWAGAGDEGADVLAGGAGNDVVAGGAGNDFIIGGGLDDGETRSLVTENESANDDGGDEVFGGDGDDTILGGGWTDSVNDNGQYDDGEAVRDGTASDQLWAGAGNDKILAAAGNDSLGGGVGDDTVRAGAGNDIVYGGKDAGDTGANDVIFGEGGNDVIFAGAGNDNVDGGAGDDDIFSGGGNDTVTGGEGADTLWGGGGNDRFTGGDGADTFVFAAGHGGDTVTDFSVSEDILRLSSTTTDFTSVADVTAAASVSGGNLVIDLGGGDTVTLQGLSLNDINQINFVF